ncbi:unnamed protein product [Brassica rapa]|uniref:Uncharacterized protein n=1 Tax=Brassica campestris TaxID=3711 RepID=A0A8D9I2H0_BRACM|nr:unnamed protein product [Brassica rapa]
MSPQKKIKSLNIIFLKIISRWIFVSTFGVESDVRDWRYVVLH